MVEWSSSLSFLIFAFALSIVLNFLDILKVDCKIRLLYLFLYTVSWIWFLCIVIALISRFIFLNTVWNYNNFNYNLYKFALHNSIFNYIDWSIFIEVFTGQVVSMYVVNMPMVTNGIKKLKNPHAYINKILNKFNTGEAITIWTPRMYFYLNRTEEDVRYRFRQTNISLLESIYCQLYWV